MNAGCYRSVTADLELNYMALNAVLESGTIEELEGSIFSGGVCLPRVCACSSRSTQLHLPQLWKMSAAMTSSATTAMHWRAHRRPNTRFSS